MSLNQFELLKKFVLFKVFANFAQLISFLLGKRFFYSHRSLITKSFA